MLDTIETPNAHNRMEHSDTQTSCDFGCTSGIRLTLSKIHKKQKIKVKSTFFYQETVSDLETELWVFDFMF